MVKLFTRKLDNKKDAIFILVFSLAIVVLANVVSQYVSLRVDMTSEKKYSLLQPTKNLIKGLKDVVIIKVYLQGNMSADFKRLQQATKDILTEMRAVGGKKIEYEFIDPLTGKTEEEQNAMLKEFLEMGLAPVNEQTGKANESKLTRVYPFAVAVYGGRQFPVQLVQSQIGYDKKQTINNSIISLEYNFANAIQKLTQYRAPRVGFASGHRELGSVEMADLQQQLMKLQYQVQTIDIHKNFQIPNLFDAIVIAKPLTAFSDTDKYKIDQYVMRGGKLLLLLDATTAEMDSLRYNPTGQFVVDRNLNLDDQLFTYGVRVNTDLVQDINLCNQIPLVVGQMGNAPQTQLFPWYYFPLLVSQNNHPINKNLDPVASFFSSSIDTVANPNIRKTILLHTSENSKAVLTPARVHFGILQQRPNPQYYSQPNIPTAVLLEGKFKSVFRNRLSADFLAMGDSVEQLKFFGESPESKMIVIADGDIVKNIVRPDSTAYPLGFYPYTNQTFANKDFMLNCIQYLVDSQGLLQTRNKDVKLRLLNTVRAANEKTKWQIINVGLPIIMVLGLGFGYNYIRRRRYGQSVAK